MKLQVIPSVQRIPVVTFHILPTFQHIFWIYKKILIIIAALWPDGVRHYFLFLIIPTETIGMRGVQILLWKHGPPRRPSRYTEGIAYKFLKRVFI